MHEPGMVGDIADRLRGKYPVGPMLPNGEPEFGWRQYDPESLPRINAEAADEIERLRRVNAELLHACREALCAIPERSPMRPIVETAIAKAKAGEG